MPPLLSFNRLVALVVVFTLLMIFLFAALKNQASGMSVHGSIDKIKDQAEKAASAAHNFCNNDRPVFSTPSFSDSIYRLFSPLKHHIAATTYVDAFGNEFNNSGNEYWKEPLGSEVLIVDIDTRVPDGENEIWNSNGKLNWETMDAGGDGGMVSASFVNHYIYSQIHGYDYKFYQAAEMKDIHNTWIKPHVLYELLHSYRFVIFIDADATIQHLDVPFEYLFNRWGITPQTSIAMPIDTRQILNGDENASCDSKGKVTLNTGVVVAQSLPLTFDMLMAWKTCTDDKRYPECSQWKNNWSHEQRAFSEYIRYDFNPDGNNIVEIACDDAMGYPGLADHGHILSDCKGQFIRHHTIDKGMTKTSTEQAIIQSISQIAQMGMRQSRQEIWVKEKGVKEENKSFWDKFTGGR